MGQLLARRQERAFERVYRRHVGDVYRYALVVLRDPEDAESVTQATFVNAYRRHKDGERPRKKHSWLLSIAHDVCHRRAEPDVPDDLFDDADLPSPRDVARALDALGFDERSVLMMREGECRSYAEIAELLELTDGEAEALIFRARKAFREQLETSLTCYGAERAISRRLDGKLGRSEWKLLKAHLEACPDCVEFEELHQRNRSVLKAFAGQPLPLGLEPRYRRGSIRTGAALRVAAVAAIVLVVGGSLATGVDPRDWGRDTTSIEPAKANTKRVVKRDVEPRVAELVRKHKPKR